MTLQTSVHCSAVPTILDNRAIIFHTVTVHISPTRSGQNWYSVHNPHTKPHNFLVNRYIGKLPSQVLLLSPQTTSSWFLIHLTYRSYIFVSDQVLKNCHFSVRFSMYWVPSGVPDISGQHTALWVYLRYFTGKADKIGIKSLWFILRWRAAS